MKTKTAYKATNKRVFMWAWKPCFIGLGYSSEYFHYDKYHCQQFQTWYLPFGYIRATQHFNKYEP